jgi:exopolyphosphatase / guanosine-5'-triphosphate,3'-diphosphate pyrophosphatase
MGQIISAIDIGSNGIRMIISEVSYDASTKSHVIREIKKIRSPIRLGKEVFLDKPISQQTINDSVETFEHFRNINQKYRVQNCRAVATSALREASNKNEFIEKIQKKSGFKIEVIDGTEEARLIYLAVSREVELKNRRCVLIDVGGGSVEITLSENAKMKQTESFPMGTVRVLDQLIKRKLDENNLKIVVGDYIRPVFEFIDKNDFHHHVDFAIGTGGNLECMARLKWDLLKKSSNTFVTLTELVEIYEKLSKMSIKERIDKLNLRPDRADVILPAIFTVKMILRQCDAHRIFVPRVGLRNGIIWSMIL